MEIALVAVMIVIGIAVASTIIAAVVIANRRPGPEARAKGFVGRDRIEAEILYEIALRSSATSDEAAEIVESMRTVEFGDFGRIDLRSWVARYADLSSRDEREHLLEDAVSAAMKTGAMFPLEQYTGLVDICFGLGFHSDALARLQQRFGFEYVDWAKHGRPREADRGGAAGPLFESRPVDLSAQCAMLGLSGRPSRQEIIAAYRRLAAESHPDRFHEAPPEEQHAASERFRKLTHAYELLLVARAGD